MHEITFEITNFCDQGCKFCSSEAVGDMSNATFISIDIIENFVNTCLQSNTMYDRINISGGEPLSHPQFYQILQLLKKVAHDILVYTNALTHICYNANAIDGIYIEADITVMPNVKKVHILKRIEQGNEKKRPEVHFSRNFTEDCRCENVIVKQDGRIVKSPCRKFEYIDKQ